MGTTRNHSGRVHVGLAVILAVLAGGAALALAPRAAALGGSDAGPPLVPSAQIQWINGGVTVFGATNHTTDPFFPQAAILGAGNLGGAGGPGGCMGSFAASLGGAEGGVGCPPNNAGRGFGTGGPLFLPGMSGTGMRCIDPIGVPTTTPGGGSAGVYCTPAFMTGTGANNTQRDQAAICWDADAPTIIAATGEVWMQGTFLRVLQVGQGVTSEFGLTYRSQCQFTGVFGPNLFCPFWARLRFEGANIVHENGVGRADLYPAAGAGVWGPAEGYARKIYLNTDGTYTLRDRFGTLHTFAGPGGSAPDNAPGGALLVAADRHDNRVVLLYSATQQLERVRDTLSRDVFEFEYSVQGRVVQVTDLIGDRAVLLNYDAEGRLETVECPPLEQSPAQQAFWGFQWGPRQIPVAPPGPAGASVVLTSVNPPVGASPGQPAAPTGPPNTYNFGGLVNTGAPVSVGKGGQAAGPGQTLAGGTYTISYQQHLFAPPGNPNDFATAVAYTTTVTSRRGLVTQFDCNLQGNVLEKREYTAGLRATDPLVFTTRASYGLDGLIRSMTFHRQNRILYSYDDAAFDHFRRQNLITVRFEPSAIPADQMAIEWHYGYESVYQRISFVTEPRGTDLTYTPQTGPDPLARVQAARYTTQRIYDYQEADSMNLPLALTAYLTRFQVDGSGMSFFNADLNGDGRFGLTSQTVGNVVRIDYPDVVLLSGQNQAAIEGGPTQQVREIYSATDAGQMLYHVDPEGNVTDMEYFPENDPTGSGVITPGGFNQNGQAWGTSRFGFRKAVVRDNRNLSSLIVRRETAELAHLREAYTYTPAGNCTTMTSPRGIRTDFLVNAWNLVNQVDRAADVSAVGVLGGDENTGLVAHAYSVHTTYDLNSNVVARAVENADSNTVSVGATVDYTYLYDILDNLIEATAEVSDSETLLTRSELDPSENVVRVHSPLATAGIQVTNRVSRAFDERDLVFVANRGEGSAEQSSMVVDYDGNRHAVESRDGVDNDGDGLRDKSLATFDGYDRLLRSTSQTGTVMEPHYDPAGHVVRVQAFGTAGGASPVGNSTAGNELLAEGFALFDELGRGVRGEQSLFTSASSTFARTPVLIEGGVGGSLVPGDGRINGMTEYDRASRVVFTVSDELEVTKTTFDGVHRVVHIEDAEQNQVATIYDRDSNPIRTLELDKAQIAGVASEIFTTIRVFDSLSRIVRETDNVGQTRRFFYDSRDNLRATSDAQGLGMTDPLGLFAAGINADGNTTETFFDGISRVVGTLRDLRVGGHGSGTIDTSNPSNADGGILVLQVWNKNSNLLSITDDGSVPSSGGNTTSYQYDALNRKIRDTFADGTTNLYVLDHDDNVRQITDENGSVHVLTFDGANRLTRRDITRASGVVGTTVQRMQWDGLSRQTLSFDDNEPSDSSDDATVGLSFDSLSRLLEERQGIRVVSSRWASHADRVGLVYPDGRLVQTAYDRVDRIAAITEGGGGTTHGGNGEPVGTLIGRYKYIGMSRVLERESGNGIVLTYLDTATRATDVGYDGARRIVAHRHIDPNGPPSKLLEAGFTYGYNRENYRTFEKREHQGGEGDAWAYDSAYRVVRAARDVANPAAEANVAGSGGTPRDLKTWQFDGLGNWDATVTNGSSASNSNNEMNEYTAFGGTAQVHDDNGNLKDDGTMAFTYDALNRMRTVTRISDGALLVTYTYDAHGLGRRVTKALTLKGTNAGDAQDPGDKDHTITYSLDGPRTLQEDNSRRGPKRQYVDGNGIDEHLEMLLLQNGKKFFYHEDAKGWVAAISAENATLVERFTYETYGTAEFRKENNALQVHRQTEDNAYLYHARNLDPESGQLHFRARQYDPVRGRFPQRDPLGLWGDEPAHGNGYLVLAASPLSVTDPTGLETCKSCCKEAYDKWFGQRVKDSRRNKECREQVQSDVAAAARQKSPGTLALIGGTVAVVAGGATVVAAIVTAPASGGGSAALAAGGGALIGVGASVWGGWWSANDPPDLDAIEKRGNEACAELFHLKARQANSECREKVRECKEKHEDCDCGKLTPPAGMKQFGVELCRLNSPHPDSAPDPAKKKK